MKEKDSKYAENCSYPAVFTYEPGQEIAVVFPDLDVATSGVDDVDALASARELLEIALYGRQKDGEMIPVPSHPMSVSVQDNERVVLVDVYMPDVRIARENCGENSQGHFNPH